VVRDLGGKTFVVRLVHFPVATAHRTASHLGTSGAESWDRCAPGEAKRHAANRRNLGKLLGSGSGGSVERTDNAGRRGRHPPAPEKPAGIGAGKRSLPRHRTGDAGLPARPEQSRDQAGSCGRGEKSASNSAQEATQASG
jgi:hypothetical protein